MTPEVQATPQWDGDSRPFRMPSERPFAGVTDNSGPVRVHVEKSGPAFVPITLADQLGASLVQQTIKATGDVIDALADCRFHDKGNAVGLMTAWTRLLKIQDMRLPLARTRARQNWEWAEMRDATRVALVSVGQPHSLMKWIVADSLMRGYAMDSAEGIESRLSVETGEQLTRLQHRAATCRAFAEGRA